MKKIIMCIGVIIFCVYLINMHKLDLIHQNSKVLIHFSPLPVEKYNNVSESVVYFYDSEGAILDKYIIDEWIVDDFIQESSSSIAFLLNNKTLQFSKKSPKIYEQKSMSFINTNFFGPSQTGFVESKNIFYSLYNIGILPGESTYINLLRISSEKESYDIILPFYIENLVYDKGTDRFVCFLSHLNTDSKNNVVRYIEVCFDNNEKVFKYDKDNIQEIDLPIQYEYLLFKNSFVIGEFILFVVLEDTEEYINDTNMLKLHEQANLSLYIYNLRNKTIEKKFIKKEYNLNNIGHGLLYGSNDLPIIEKNSKLYVFTIDKKIYTIDDEFNINEYILPYDFNNMLNVKQVNNDELYEKEDFFNTEIVVEDDGNIFILTIDINKQLNIFCLKSNGCYELIWKGSLPEDLGNNVFINTFEIVQ